MRSFELDPNSKLAKLNGKPYFLRGSNITLYRFFEDSECGALPWDANWVRLLHRRMKEMHWNCLRYCIGFPPEAWYRTADEEGILLLDEFPIWYGGTSWSKWPQGLKSDELALEYAEWMRERWNHPSVVIWDASNETASRETGLAVQKVRGLDLSHRPWDNSYGIPRVPGDVFESHPYHFQNPKYILADLSKEDSLPQGNELRNDDESRDWKGKLRFRLLKGSQVLQEQKIKTAVPAFGRVVLKAPMSIPGGSGAYQVEAILEVSGGDVHSLRDFVVAPIAMSALDSHFIAECDRLGRSQCC